MSLAVIGFNFRNNTYLVFDTDTQTAKLMTRPELLNQNVSEAKIENDLIKPIHPESRYFQEELYSSQMPQLQGYITEALANNTFKVYTNQDKITQLTAEEISKLYTVLNANLTFPEGVPKVSILYADTIPAINLGPVKVQSADSLILKNNASPVSQTTEKLLNIFRQDIKGYCVTNARGWPAIYSYKTSEILKALKAWVSQDYPNLSGFFNYFLKYPLLYIVEGKTPLLERKSYIYAMYNLLKAQIIYDSAIQEIKSGKKVPTLPLTIRPFSPQMKWERKLMDKLPADQKKYLKYIVDPNSIRHQSNEAIYKVSNIHFIMHYKHNKDKLTLDYTDYNTKLYTRYADYVAKRRAQGMTVLTESLDSITYLASLATLHLHTKDNAYKNYCFIKIPRGYIKLTRPRNKEDFGYVIPKVEKVQLPETGVKFYEFSSFTPTSNIEVVQIMETLLYYANRTVKHYNYRIENDNHIYIERISDKKSFDLNICDFIDINEVLNYMYS